MSAHLARFIGYDPTHVEPLPVAQRRALAGVAAGLWPGTALIGLSAGYGAFLTSDSVGLGVVVGLVAPLYLVNLMRVSVAGGGVAPHQSLKTTATWTPRVVPLVMLACLGGFFAQPLILLALESEHDPMIRELQTALTEMHEQAVAFPARAALSEAKRALEASTRRQTELKQRLERATGELVRLEREGGRDGAEVERRVVTAAAQEDATALRAVERQVDDSERAVARWSLEEARVRTDDVAPYAAHLERSHFLLRRIQLTWASPLRPVALTALMVVLMVLPWVISATLARAAHRAYERRRWASTRALIETAYQRARTEEEAALRRWPTFTSLRGELYADAPYNTRPAKAALTGGATHG